MELKDLTATQKFLMGWLQEKPHHKFIGNSRNEMNVLASLGVARYAGNLQYELTDSGKELLKEHEYSLELV